MKGGEKKISGSDLGHGVAKIFKMKDQNVPPQVDTIDATNVKFADVAVAMDKVLVGQVSARHIMIMLADQSVKFADVLPLWSPEQVSRFLSEDGFLAFSREQQISVATCLERAYTLVARRVMLDDEECKTHKRIMREGGLPAYAAEVLRLHSCWKELKAAIDEACWLTKTKEKEKLNRRGD